MTIKIIRQRITREELVELAQETFVEMVKAVVDVKRKILAAGGELHADAEAVLLADGSQQADLWGINLYLEKRREEWVEFTSLINIRPSAGNRSIEIQDLNLRERISEIVRVLVE